MNLLDFKSSFCSFMGVKTAPNDHEKSLFQRAQKYSEAIKTIPGIEMIAVCNSLSMYATHENSDIDLFIITKPHMLWFVRCLVTFRFWRLGVWRKGEDIAGNFCLSFFITTDALDLSRIALEDDVYLFYWIYFLKPLFEKGDMYERFLSANRWVEVDPEQQLRNRERCLSSSSGTEPSILFRFFESFARSFLRPKTLRSFKKLGEPAGVIITDDMLKFHDQDKRAEIRDQIKKKNNYGQI